MHAGGHRITPLVPRIPGARIKAHSESPQPAQVDGDVIGYAYAIGAAFAPMRCADGPSQGYRAGRGAEIRGTGRDGGGTAPTDLAQVALPRSFEALKDVVYDLAEVSVFLGRPFLPGYVDGGEPGSCQYAG